jgi:hypothetical protein
MCARVYVCVCVCVNWWELLEVVLNTKQKASIENFAALKQTGRRHKPVLRQNNGENIMQPKVRSSSILSE